MATQVKTDLIANNAITDAKIADVTLTTATQSASDNSTKIATTAYVTTAIANLSDSAPATLNTLNELAAALGDDANFSTTVTNNIAAKLPLAGGTLTGNVFSGNKTGLTDTNTGHAFAPGGLVYHATDGTITQSLNRITDDGPVLRLVGNGTTAGSVGVLSGGLSFGSGTSMTTRMVITSGGLVGIGADSPGSELHVKGTNETQVWIDSATNTNPGIRLLENTSSKWTIANDSTNDGLFFYDFGSSAERMRIKGGNGHVGIGTNNPRYNLTVEGNNTTAIGIGVDNISGSSTLDIAALGSGYNNHGAAGGEVWFFSPDNINIGGATGQTNNIKFIANNNLNMVINGDGSGIGMKQKVIMERSVNGSGSVSYEEILKISRIGGATSNNQREAAISFFDSANDTYTAMITGVRTSPSGNYDGGLNIYTNSHSQNANATSISEMVSGKVVSFTAAQATEFFGDVYVSGANHRISQNGVTRESKGGYIAGNTTVSYTINHTNQSVMHIRCGFNHYGLMSYGCALDQVYANGSGGLTSTTAVLNHTSGAGGSWSVSRVDTDNITVTKNAGTYGGGGYYYIIVEGANL